MWAVAAPDRARPAAVEAKEIPVAADARRAVGAVPVVVVVVADLVAERPPVGLQSLNHLVLRTQHRVLQPIHQPSQRPPPWTNTPHDQ